MYSQGQKNESFVASGDLSACVNRIVDLLSTAFKVGIATAAGGFGVLANAPKDGEHASVATDGVVMVRVGASVLPVMTSLRPHPVGVRRSLPAQVSALLVAPKPALLLECSRLFGSVSITARTRSVTKRSARIGENNAPANWPRSSRRSSAVELRRRSAPARLHRGSARADPPGLEALQRLLQAEL
jgi:hypothetical protein